MKEAQQELQRRISEILKCAEEKEVELETFKSEYAKSHFDAVSSSYHLFKKDATYLIFQINERQLLQSELEKVQTSAASMHDVSRKYHALTPLNLRRNSKG